MTDPRPTSPRSLRDYLAIAGGASVVITGSIAIFTAAYLSALRPLVRVIPWIDRIDLSTISIHIQLIVWFSVLLKYMFVANPISRLDWLAITARLLAIDFLLAIITEFGFFAFSINNRDFMASICMALVSVLICGCEVAYFEFYSASITRRRAIYTIVVLIAGAYLWVLSAGYFKGRFELSALPRDVISFSGPNRGADYFYSVNVVYGSGDYIALIYCGSPLMFRLSKDDQPVISDAPCFDGKSTSAPPRNRLPPCYRPALMHARACPKK